MSATGSDAESGKGCWLSPAKAILAAVAILVLVAVAYKVAVFLSFALRPTGVVIRNKGTKTLSAVEIDVEYPGGTVARSWDDVEAGEEILVPTEATVISIRLSFTLDGQSHVHEDGTDLWRGELWAMEILSDGSVRSGYDHGSGIIGHAAGDD